MIRVLIADDEPMVRAGIRSILTADADIHIVADAADGRTAVEQARRHRPDVAVLDIRMPGVDGLTATRQIRADLPETAVIILTTFGEDEYIARALDYGAAGFLLKALDPRELIAGVHAVASGAACLSPVVAQRVITELRRSGPSRGQAARTRVAALAPRERDVLALVGSGLSNADIAKRLHLVEGTVKTYVSAILSRLEIRNRVQAAIIAVEAGLVDHPSKE
ncbi:response regulator transcription factor [Micromonospora sp. C51]|uniref:response regulator n=1 Tax=Micromonospora sp. C51 TaxID=2824879 RepID=UPI001B38196E|nr:response regulator transcription factor [Micromonospora sp. C51]MBQ1052052.1 response regulator transcription factor [Micromonospora sp. C51]